MAYPTTWDTFTTKSTGDTIMVAHINGLQTAIVAIEEKLGSGTPYTASTNTALLGTGASSTGYAVISLANTSLVTGTLPTSRGGTDATAAANTANGVCILDAGAHVYAANIPSLFSAWVDKSASYGAQQAATDGLVVASVTMTGSKTLSGYTDTNADPTTKRVDGSTSITQVSIVVSLTMPVRQGDYWKIVTDGTVVSVYWIPVGS